MYQILETGKNVSLIISSDAKKYKPHILYGTVKYDPDDNFMPINRPRLKRLHESLIEEAQKLYDTAKEYWKPQKNLPSEPASKLEELIAESVSRIAAENIVEAVKPKLNKFINETYGVLPKLLRVQTPTSTNVVKGITHEKFETVLKIVNMDIPVFLTGPAGSGKNVICKQVSEALGTEFYFSNAITQEYKLTGFIDANGRYHETQFFKAFTNGGVFMLDEIDASTPEVLVILNAAIANKYFDFPTGRVEAHKDLRIIAAGNTYGTGADLEYTGRYQLDAASLDRFAIIEIDYSIAIEIAIAEGNTDLVNFIHSFRKSITDSKIKFTVSYRAVERLHKLEQIFERSEAIKIAILKGLEVDDARIIANNMIASSYTSALLKAVA